jgi:hypothetical protein
MRGELRRLDTISRDDTPSVTAPSVVVDGIRFAERGEVCVREGRYTPGVPAVRNAFCSIRGCDQPVAAVNFLQGYERLE